jgi:hypothetical protein
LRLPLTFLEASLLGAASLLHILMVQFRGKPLILVIGRWWHPGIAFLLGAWSLGLDIGKRDREGEAFASRLLWQQWWRWLRLSILLRRVCGFISDCLFL